MTSMKPRYAMNTGEERVIRGKLTHVQADLYQKGQLLISPMINPNAYPHQKNNMTAWYQEALKVLLPQRSFLRHYINVEPEFEVNFGFGRKTRENTQLTDLGINVFSYKWEDGTRIDVVIHTTLHSTEWWRKNGKQYLADRKDGYFMKGGEE